MIPNIFILDKHILISSNILFNVLYILNELFLIYPFDENIPLIKPYINYYEPLNNYELILLSIKYYNIYYN